jgi:YjbE family integral membrane protein
MNADMTALLLQGLEIIWINILLSGDNAVVIALACRTLPERERRWGILIGSAVAVALRVIFAFLVVELLTFPLVKLIGGLLLFWIAVKLLIVDTDGNKELRHATTIWMAVRIIAIADAIMSLDNVIAIAAAAAGSPLLIVFGLAVSVPLIIFGSTLLLSVLDRFPALVWVGAGLLGWVAAELMISDPVWHDWIEAHSKSVGHVIETWAPPAGAILVLLVGSGLHWRRKEAKAGPIERP